MTTARPVPGAPAPFRLPPRTTEALANGMRACFVEAGEAEWNLDTLEGLFDFYFVQPAVLQAKKEALNKKLSGAGKPTLP